IYRSIQIITQKLLGPFVTAIPYALREYASRTRRRCLGYQCFFFHVQQQRECAMCDGVKNTISLCDAMVQADGRCALMATTPC
ncbi:unnamed protein product, partial [Callosobruchus maculatus]